MQYLPNDGDEKQMELAMLWEEKTAGRLRK